MDTYALLVLCSQTTDMNIVYKYHGELYLRHCAELNGGGAQKGGGGCIHKADSLCCAVEANTGAEESNCTPMKSIKQENSQCKLSYQQLMIVSVSTENASDILKVTHAISMYLWTLHVLSRPRMSDNV